MSNILAAAWPPPVTYEVAILLTSETLQLRSNVSSPRPTKEKLFPFIYLRLMLRSRRTHVSSTLWLPSRISHGSMRNGCIFRANKWPIFVLDVDRRIALRIDLKAIQNRHPSYEATTCAIQRMIRAKEGESFVRAKDTTPSAPNTSRSPRRC